MTGNPTCPDQGPTVMFTWQKWDALNGCWWDNNNELGSGGLLGVQPLSAFITNHPDAAIRNPSGLGGLRLAVGFASSTDTFDGNVDLVTVGVSGQGTSYDFEPASGCQKGDGEGDFDDQDGHRHHAHFHHDSCENGGGDARENDSDSGKHFESTSVSSAAFTFDADSQTLTMIGTGLDNGLPVGFTMVAVANGDVGPGVFALILTDGYRITGSLPSGSIVIP